MYATNLPLEKPPALIQIGLTLLPYSPPPQLYKSPQQRTPHDVPMYSSCWLLPPPFLPCIGCAYLICWGFFFFTSYSAHNEHNTRGFFSPTYLPYCISFVFFYCKVCFTKCLHQLRHTSPVVVYVSNLNLLSHHFLFSYRLGNPLMTGDDKLDTSAHVTTAWSLTGIGQVF